MSPRYPVVGQAMGPDEGVNTVFGHRIDLDGDIARQVQDAFQATITSRPLDVEDQAMIEVLVRLLERAREQEVRRSPG